MSAVYVSPDLTGPLRLKQLIGPAKVGRLAAGQHPLAGGFAALRKQLIGRARLSVQERQELGNLRLAARMVFEQREHWEPYRKQFVADLCKADACTAILFELHVMEFALKGRVSSLEWLRYQEGTPDIRTGTPEMLVECKLIRSENLDRIPDKLREGHEQHRGLAVPYVIAVGFEHELGPQHVAHVRRLAEELARWFQRHPGVTAALIFTPEPPSRERYEIFGLPATMIRHGVLTAVVNQTAEKPLPKGFAFTR